MFLVVFRLIFVFFVVSCLSSCGGPCKSLEDESTDLYTTIVESNPEIYDPSDPKQYWFPGGFYITNDLLAKIEVSGSVNLCSKNTGTSISESNIEVPVSSTVPTPMFVKPQDFLRFSLVQHQYDITNCDAPPSGVYVWDKNICKNGGKFTIEGIEQVIDKYEGTTMYSDISPIRVDSTSNRYAPRSNFALTTQHTPPYTPTVILIPEAYYYEKDGTTIVDIFPPLAQETEAAFYEIAKIRYPGLSPEEGFEKLLKTYRCDDSGVTEPGFGNFVFDRNTTTFGALVDYCGFKRTIPILSKGQMESTPRPRTIKNGDYLPKYSNHSYSWYSYLEEVFYENVQEPGSSSDPFTVYLTKNKFIGRLVANIGDRKFPDMNFDNPEMHFRDSSAFHINPDYQYRANEEGQVFLSFDHNSSSGSTVTGGYLINIKRTCSGQDYLYMYITNDKSGPGVFPGEGDSIKIPLPLEISDPQEDLRINGFHPPKSGWVFFGIKDNGEGYDSNSGAFKIEAKVPKVARMPVTKLIEWVREPLVFRLFGAEEEDGTRVGGIVNLIYNRLITSKDFKQIVQAACSLLIAIYSAMFVVGMINITFKTLVTVLIKISIVWQLFMPNSWEFFNSFLFSLFTEGTEQLIGIMTSPPDVDSIGGWNFAFFDKTTGIFLDFSTWLKLLSFFFATPVGWFYCILYIWGSWALVTSTILAILTYFGTIVVVGVLISISPIFIAAILFEYTSNMFNSWLKVIINACFHPIFIFSAISFLSSVAIAIINNAMGFGICSGCVGEMNIADNVFPFCFANMPIPSGVSNYVDIEDRLNASSADTVGYGFLGIPISVATVLSYLIICNVMKKFVFISADISSAIFGVFVGAMGGNDPNAASGIVGKVERFFGMDDQSKMERAHGMADVDIWSKRNPPAASRAEGQTGSSPNPSPRTATGTGPAGTGTGPAGTGTGGGTQPNPAPGAFDGDADIVGGAAPMDGAVQGGGQQQGGQQQAGQQGGQQGEQQQGGQQGNNPDAHEDEDRLIGGGQINPNQREAGLDGNNDVNDLDPERDDPGNDNGDETVLRGGNIRVDPDNNAVRAPDDGAVDDVHRDIPDNVAGDRDVSGGNTRVGTGDTGNRAGVLPNTEVGGGGGLGGTADAEGSQDED